MIIFQKYITYDNYLFQFNSFRYINPTCIKSYTHNKAQRNNREISRENDIQKMESPHWPTCNRRRRRRCRRYRRATLRQNCMLLFSVSIHTHTCILYIHFSAHILDQLKTPRSTLILLSCLLLDMFLIMGKSYNVF